MNIYGNYKSPLGYQSGENYIDSYGVDHSGFSTRDEIEYQMARLAKENQIMQNFNKLGITKNYPQYGTNFWGNSDNNYGFGNSQISSNIENMQKSFSADNFDITGRTNLNNTQNINGNTLGNIVNNTLTETKGYHSLSNMMDSNNYYNPIEQALQMDIASVLSPKPLGNDANSYQIAQNTTPNTVSDVGNQILTKYKKLIDEHYNEIYKNEGNPNYVYLDPKYIKSIGRGKNINNVNTFNQVNYKIKGTNDFANEKEKQECYNNFEKWIKQNKKNLDDEHNFKASYFEDFCDLYIDPNEEKRLHNDHVVQDIPIIKNIIKNYDNLSYEKQLAILDMVYNLGTTKFNNQFTNFIKAANANSEEGMLAEYHRKDISESRNKWTADLLKK